MDAIWPSMLPTNSAAVSLSIPAASFAAAAASLSSFVASVGPAGDWSRAADVAILRPGLAAPGLVALLLGGAAWIAPALRGQDALDQVTVDQSVLKE